MSSLNTNSVKTNTILMLVILCYKLPLDKVESFLIGLTHDKSLFSKVLSLIKHQNSMDLNTFTEYDIYLLATKVNIEEFVLFQQAITNSQIKLQKIESLKKQAKELGVLNKEAQRILQGKDIINLGIKPSKDFSKILDKAYNAQIYGKFKTEKEARLWLKKELIS